MQTTSETETGEAGSQQRPGSGPRPPVVCLCGSTRFVEAFNEWRKRLTYQGKIVLSIEIVTSQAKHEDPQHVNGELKAMLDELHLRKIDLADEVMVLNVDGYVGESTAREIIYATRSKKTVRLLEPYLLPESQERLKAADAKAQNAPHEPRGAETTVNQKPQQ